MKCDTQITEKQGSIGWFGRHKELCIQVSRGLLHCKVSLQQYMFAFSNVYGCDNPSGKKIYCSLIKPRSGSPKVFAIAILEMKEDDKSCHLYLLQLIIEPLIY